MNKKTLPTECPGCGERLHVSKLDCPACNTAVSGQFALPHLTTLSNEDREFAFQFVLASGSLKEVARQYGVSYPTVRNRLDDIIGKLREIRDESEKD